jgi:hypothetical protein
MGKRSRSRPSRESLADGFRALRIDTVLFSPGTAGLLAATALSSSVAIAAARLGFLVPGGWLWPASIGTAATVLKVMFDFYDRSGDPALWKQFLSDRFAQRVPPDPEIQRLCLLVIDLRSRLAEAEVRADEHCRTLVADPMLALDGWIEGIARLADRLHELRIERGFQQELADSSRRRLARINAQQAMASDPQLMRQLAATSGGVSQQILAATRFCAAADGGMLKLEHAVAAFGTVGSQLLLVMSRGTELGDGDSVVDRIGVEVSALDGLLQALDSVTGMSEAAWATVDAVLPPANEHLPHPLTLDRGRNSVRGKRPTRGQID